MDAAQTGILVECSLFTCGEEIYRHRSGVTESGVWSELVNLGNESDFEKFVSLSSLSHIHTHTHTHTHTHVIIDSFSLTHIHTNTGLPICELPRSVRLCFTVWGYHNARKTAITRVEGVRERERERGVVTCKRSDQSLLF